MLFSKNSQVIWKRICEANRKQKKKKELKKKKKQQHVRKFFFAFSIHSKCVLGMRAHNYGGLLFVCLLFSCACRGLFRKLWKTEMWFFFLAEEVCSNLIIFFSCIKWVASNREYNFTKWEHCMKYGFVVTMEWKMFEDSSDMSVPSNWQSL